MLVDFPYEIVSQTRDFGVDLQGVKTILVTHSHKDHFHPYILAWRFAINNDICLNIEKFGPRFSPLPLTTLYGNREVCRLTGEELGKLENYALSLHEIHPFEEFGCGGKTVMPVRANHHTEKTEPPLNFIIFDGVSTLFYGLDSGWFLPETYEVIKKYKFDAVIVEGTFGLASVDEQHFDFKQVKAAKQLFAGDGLLKKGSAFIATHFCPHHSPTHDEIEAYFAGENIIPAYDGMEIEIGDEKCS
jgi:phosphoribosyl 1,2-cyclic phosphate phosphodiesterase